MKLYPDNMSDLVLISITLFIALWLTCYYAYQSSIRMYRKPKSTWFIFSLLLSFCVFAFFDTDFFHYQWNYLNIQRGHEERSNFEDIYVFIGQNVSDYLLFRCIVWGTAIFCLFKTFRVLRLDFNQAILIFVSIGLLKFAYARASLAMAIIYLGLALYATQKNALTKPIKIFLSLAVIACAFYFHKSAAFGIAIAILSLIPLNKTRLTVLIALFPVCVLIVQYGLYDFIMSMDSDSESFSVQTAQTYLNTEYAARGISGIIRIIIERTPYYTTFLLIVISIYKHIYARFNYNVKVFLNATFYVIYVASILLFVRAEVTVFYYRFLYFASIPMAIALSYYSYLRQFSKWIKFAVIIGLTAELYTLSYSLYIQIVNS